ncbi:MAG TPA: hypothetical protein VF316_24090 [Polyangiaceae bacterium]
MQRTSFPSSWILALVACAAGAACDDKEASNAVASASAAPSATEAPPPPPPAKPPVVVVEDTVISVSGERIDASGDAKGRLVAILNGRPKVAGEIIEIQALRDVKYPRVATTVAALREAKAKGAVVKTALRDRSLGELSMDFKPPAACSPMAMIAKDNAVLVWPASGGVAQRYTHGMAGPDLTLGSDGVRRLGASCESSTFVVAGDETTKWGLVFDLAVAVRTVEGGAPKLTQAWVPSETVVPGHKL